jgi:uncharacterized protein YfaP (DUF2135 family)
MKSTVKYSIVALIAVLAATSLSFYQFKSDKKDNHGRFVPKTVFVFGPKMFVRPAGKPVAKVEKFSVLEDVTEPFTLDVLNGFSVDRDHDWNWYRGRRDDDRDMRNRGKKSMVTTATVKLNGIVVLSPSDFGNPSLRDKKHEILITKPVSLNLSGTNTLEVTIEGKPGSFIFLAITGTKGSTADTTKPQLTLNDGQSTITNEQSITVSGTVTDQSAVTVTVNGSAVPVSNGSFSTSVNLVEGTNEITVVATDAYGNQTVQNISVIKDSTPPTLTILSLTDGMITNDTVATVFGTVTDSTAETVTVNGTPVTVDPDTFKTTVHLVEGVNTITVVATDAAGNQTTSVIHVTLDTIPPKITLSSLSDTAVTNQNVVQINGTVSDSTSVTLKVNGEAVPVSSGSFSTIDTIVEGFNGLTFTATDAAGNTTMMKEIVRLYTIPPVITVQSPQDSSVIYDSTVTIQGSVADSIQTTVAVNGNSTSVNSDGSFIATAPTVPGINQITLSATDAAGNTSSKELSIKMVPLPPDPAKVAPKIDPTVVTTVGAATKFLYTGSNPIQTGVDTSMMDEVRAGVIRGRVLSKDDQPLPGVTVSILNHPEFGQTISRADGMYDMAINGGGQLTVNLARDGYLTAQRQVNTYRRDYFIVDSVILVQLDPRVTVVRKSDSISVAKGSIVTDENGTRQVALMFKPGTQATMKTVHYRYDTLTSGGSRQIIKTPTDTVSVPLDSISFRATEYTVGPNGPQSMPAGLPPTTAYTYCVELSADEAIAAGANTIEFTKPVVSYLDNFLNVPPGYIVPVGFYDRSRGQWIAMQDGVVLRIIDTTGGKASIDIRGKGVAAARASLDSLGIDSLEQVKLASLYSPGKTLWRMQTNHFSPLDWNFAYVLIGGAPFSGDLNGPNMNVLLN